MSEPYGRTDMHSCGCIDDADGYLLTRCARHRREELIRQESINAAMGWDPDE